jgi:hypothetical protein
MKIIGLILTFFTSFFISSEENQFWKPTFEQIILFVDKYDDKGASASYVKENSLEVKAGNPPEFLVKVYVYDHPSSGLVSSLKTLCLLQLQVDPFSVARAYYNVQLFAIHLSPYL